MFGNNRCEANLAGAPYLSRGHNAYVITLQESADLRPASVVAGYICSSSVSLA